MTPTLAVFTFINCWFVMLFFVIPFWTKPTVIHKEGDYRAAPEPMRWKKLLLVNTLVSLVVTAGLAWLIGSGLLPMDNG